MPVTVKYSYKLRSEFMCLKSGEHIFDSAAERLSHSCMAVSMSMIQSFMYCYHE